MEILTINLGATETKQFRKAGGYFEILESVGAIGVRFSSVNGGQINSIDGGMSGLFLSADFGAFDIANQSGAAQTIKVLVCDVGEVGGSRRQPGNVRIIDEITDQVLRTGLNPSTATTAFLASTLIAAASNTKGLIVRGCSMNGQAGAGGSIAAALVAAKSVPTGFNAPAQMFGFLGLNESAGVFTQKDLSIVNKLLPVGWGLYHLQAISTAAAAASGVIVYTELVP